MWAGLITPGGPTRQVVDFTPIDLPRIPAPSVADHSAIDGAALHARMSAICALTEEHRDGSVLWGRPAGSPAALAVVDKIDTELRSLEYSTQRHPIPFIARSVPESWNLTVSAEGEDDLTLLSAVPVETAGTDRRGGGVAEAVPQDLPREAHATGPIRYLGDADPTVIASTDVVGAIVLFRVAGPGSWFYDAPMLTLAQLAASGAVAAIVMVDLPGNMQTVVAASPVGFPAMAVGREDGSFLLAALRAGVSVNAAIDVEYREPEQKEAIALHASLAGRSSTEAIVLSAHSDAFFAGADDNASGLAVFLGIAAEVARTGPLEHELHLFLSPGHHDATGGMTALEAAVPGLAGRTVLALNLEHMAQMDVHPSYMRTEPDAYGRVRPTLLPTGGDYPGREVTVSHRSDALAEALRDAALRSQYIAPAAISQPAIAEPSAFVTAGGIALQSVQTGPWFHTSGDDPITISPEGLQRAALFYSVLLEHADAGTRAAFSTEPGGAT
jgi:hypothetical protein